MFDYENKCPKCGAGTAVNGDGTRFCVNVGMESDHSDGCDWKGTDSISMLTTIRNLDQVAVFLKAVTPELIGKMSAGQRKVIRSFLSEQAKRYATDKEG